ncbi:MAG TPA: alpha/beta hydrolase [Gemmatimonadaceae bacterium]|nr:alpha/beta hydrolase [Gemmatimonadaceae bacterium]
MLLPLRRNSAAFLSPDRWYPCGDSVARSRFVVLGSGERVRVVEAGGIGSPIAVLLHGWGTSAYSFRRLVPALLRRGFAVFVPDLRGHGLSDKPAQPSLYSSPAMVEFVLALLDALGLSRVHLVGESMGAAVVRDLLEVAPQRAASALLLAPVGLTPIRRIALGRILRPGEWRPGHVPRWLVELVVRRVHGAPGSWSAEDVDQYWAPFQFLETLAALFALVHRFDWSVRPPLADAIPLGIALGTEDKLVRCCRALASARQYRGAIVEVVPGAGHVLAVDAPERVADLLAAVAR